MINNFIQLFSTFIRFATFFINGDRDNFVPIAIYTRNSVWADVSYCVELSSLMKADKKKLENPN